MLQSDMLELQREIKQALAQKPTINKSKPSNTNQALQQELMFYNMAIDKLKAQIATANTPTTPTNPLTTNGTRRKSTTRKQDGNLETLPHYFYQAADGQHYYLHPLDLQILLHHFKHADQQPPDLHIPVQAIQETTVTTSIRTQFPHLSHLPIGCDVTIVEADLREIVSENTLSEFSQKLELRTAQRKARARKEAREMMRAASAKFKARAATAERVRNAHPEFSTEYVEAMALENAWLFEAQGSSIAGSAPASFTNDIEWVASHVASSSNTPHNKSLVSFAEIAKASPNWRRSDAGLVGSSTKTWPNRPISASPAPRRSSYAYEVDLFGDLVLTADESTDERSAGISQQKQLASEDEHAEFEDDEYDGYDEPDDSYHGAASNRKSGRRKQ